MESMSFFFDYFLWTMFRYVSYETLYLHKLNCGGSWIYLHENNHYLTAEKLNTFIMSTAMLQMLGGVIHIAFAWSLPDGRKLVLPSKADIRKLIPLALYTYISFVASMIAYAYSGPVFVHVAKAFNPFVNALFSHHIYNNKISFAKWCSLVPIVGGVCLAAGLGDNVLDYTMESVAAVIVFNIFYTLRCQELKLLLLDSDFKLRLGGSCNILAWTTILSVVISIIFSFIIEGNKYQEFIDFNLRNRNLLPHFFVASLAYYLHNEFSIPIIGAVSSVTYSVANIFRCMMIVLCSSLIFHHPLSDLQAVGCLLCTSGTLMFSLVDQLTSKHVKAISIPSISPEHTEKKIEIEKPKEKGI